MTDSGTLSLDKPTGLAGRSPMASPPAVAPGRVATAEQDVLLATKLHVPGPQPGFVPRPRLVGALGEGLARGRVLVCAPAGFGKTALLADWARRGGRPVAWLGLDAGDSDPARFWRYAVAALERARPGLAGRVGPLLGPSPPRSFEGLVTALINELAAQPGPEEVLLVLDDYHLVDSGPVHESVAFLLEHLPPGLAVVVSGRADPPLPLARQRGRGQLAELRAAELRFTGQEAAALLGETAGPGLPEAAVAALVDRTEGWAAGLQLAGLSLRGQPDPAGFVAAFCGSHRFVVDYLTDEVLERQDGPVRGFLLETSVLDRLSGELCDAVTGRAGSQAMLERVERAGLFLVPLDEGRGWWRYHHLFADLLRTRLQRDQPGRVRELHRNAAAWSDEHGLADDAVRHALAAGDAAWAGRLIERHVDALLFRVDQATLQRRLETLPAELVRSRPRLLLVQAWIKQWAGEVEAAGPLLDAAERAFANAADEAFEPSVGSAASLLVNVPAAVALARAYLAHLRGDAEATAAFASRARAEVGAGEWMLDSRVRWHVAVAEWLRGSLAGAERAFTSVIARWRAAGDPGYAAPSCHLLGQVQLAQGRLDAALGTYRQALEIATVPGRPALPVAGIGYVGLAKVAYQRNELDAALGQVTEGIARCRQIFYTPPLVTGLAALAWIRQAQGDAGEALAAMGEAERAAPGPAVTGLLNPVPAERARLLLAQGDLAGATRWAHDNGLDAGDELAYPREPGHLVLARLLLAQGRPGLALVLLDRLHEAATAQGRDGSIVEIGALRALALAASGEEPTAVTALAGTLMLASPQGYVRVFADEGAPMSALLGQLAVAHRAGQSPAAAVPAGYLAALVGACGPADAAPPQRRAAATTPPGLVEPLTDRELEVLRLLAAGRSNQRIAHDLVVALDTVKKHVTHVLGKLGAANRTEAAAQARQLGLIP
jgi:LuxR family transcriptional regulator, maltose regulon positive regulatory protein